MLNASRTYLGIKIQTNSELEVITDRHIFWQRTIHCSLKVNQLLYSLVYPPTVSKDDKTILTRSTHSMSGTRTVWLPSSDTTQAGVSGLASIRASTASAPILQPCTSINHMNINKHCLYTHPTALHVNHMNINEHCLYTHPTALHINHMNINEQCQECQA